MSEWHRAGKDDIEISEDGETVDIFVKQDFDSGNIYVEVRVEDIKELLGVKNG